MALQVGNAACTTGMSQRIYLAIVGGTSTGLSSPLTTAQADSLKAIAYGIAVGVVGEIQTNGTVSVSAPIDAFGAGIPASYVTLGGSIT